MPNPIKEYFLNRNLLRQNPCLDWFSQLIINNLVVNAFMFGLIIYLNYNESKF
jgi:hypothetical protein